MKTTCITGPITLKRLLVAVLLILSAKPVAAQVVYRVTAIGSFDGPTGESMPLAINDQGEVVGWAYRGPWPNAFIWNANDGLFNIGVLPGFERSSVANGINELGQVVGTSEGQYEHKAFIWSRPAGIRPLGDPFANSARMGAFDINDNGVSVGIAGSSPPIPVVWSEELQPQIIGSQSVAHGINNAGLVVGWNESSGRAFVWQEASGVIELPDSNATSATAQAVNDLGAIAGDVRLGFHDPYPAYWRANGELVVVGNVPGSRELGFFFDINNHNVAVGASLTDGSDRRGAFIWDEAGGLRQLNDLLHPESQGWNLVIARGINNHGQIVGWGRSPAGLPIGWVANPIPEPSTIGLIASIVGTAVLLRLRFVMKRGECINRAGQRRRTSTSAVRSPAVFVLVSLLPKQAPASEFMLTFQGTIDGSDAIRVEPDRAVWSHRHWSWPTSVNFNGINWQPQQQPELVPGGQLLIPADLKNYRATVIRSAGRDEITAEIKDDHVLIQLADSPNGGGSYQFQIVLSPRLPASSPSAELKVRGAIDGSGRLRIDPSGASWLNRFFAAPSSLSLNGIAWNPIAQPVLPNAGATQFLPAGLDFSSARLTKQAGHDMVGLEIFDDRVEVVFVDTPVGTDTYEATLQFGGPATSTTLGQTGFSLPPIGATSFPSGQPELGFQTTTTPSGGVNPLVGVIATSTTPTSPVFTHSSLNATTIFDPVDLRGWSDVSVSVDLQVRSTNYETGDFLLISVSNGLESIDLFDQSGIDNVDDGLESLAGDGFLTYFASIPNDWTEARLTITSSSNSTTGAERYDFDNIEFHGVFVIPEPSTLYLGLIGLTIRALFALASCRQTGGSTPLFPGFSGLY